MKKDIIRFIEEHNKQYINYFEAVILPDGHIEYSIPSHTYKLEMLWGVPLDEIYDGGDSYNKLREQMPMSASPIHWLCNKLNVVVCWYNQSLFPMNYTKEQVETFKLLIKSKCVYGESDIDISNEDLITSAEYKNTKTLEDLYFKKICRIQSLKNDLGIYVS